MVEYLQHYTIPSLSNKTTQTGWKPAKHHKSFGQRQKLQNHVPQQQINTDPSHSNKTTKIQHKSVAQQEHHPNWLNISKQHKLVAWQQTTETDCTAANESLRSSKTTNWWNICKTTQNYCKPENSIMTKYVYKRISIIMTMLKTVFTWKWCPPINYLYKSWCIYFKIWSWRIGK